jgi:hypothetical protein
MKRNEKSPGKTGAFSFALIVSLLTTVSDQSNDATLIVPTFHLSMISCDIIFVAE